MKKSIFLILITLTAGIYSCKNEVTEEKVIHVDPLVHFEEVDAFLQELADAPQKYSVPTDTLSVVTGTNGTIINVDPKNLETVDGSPMGEEIEVKLVEMVGLDDFIYNNAQTVSNGEVIETGGAYDITMTSDGKELKIKDGKGIEVEFPRISEKDMEVFMGERDSLGQVNWEATNEDFEEKDIPEPEKPSRVIQFSLNGEKAEKKLSDKEYEEYLEKNKDYLRRQQIIKRRKRTYDAINILNLGLCNVDRYRDSSKPLVDVKFKIKNKENFDAVRIYSIFSEFNALVSKTYFKALKDTPELKGITEDKEFTIIALSVKDGAPYIYETTLNTTKGSAHMVEIDLKRTNDGAIEKRMNALNEIQ